MVISVEWMNYHRFIITIIGVEGGRGVVVSIVFLIFYICVSDEYMYYFNK